ncbi:MAG: T9SS type A sorting domain-containing protein [Bacteroidia bacterium]|nr:T9SS type A sorting domain-containing protein [Bacteroidia bacterium]
MIIFRTEQNKNKFDISNLSSGLYFISVKQGQKYFTQKFIKQ